MTIEIRFPNQLREYRKQAGLTQNEVARLLSHASSDRISHWEKGNALPNIVNLFKLAVVYGATPKEMYRELYESIAKELGSMRPSPLRLEQTIPGNIQNQQGGP